ncbi:unnamed protein product [Phytophthora lilii]|uniref:Unnamed protein product n=1 Tax=Phytophthora lilii TaxID=2077276 RepID=A0A9W6TSN5_9STRA|nr:unnamed protein product [Phytophthora lilii]
MLAHGFSADFLDEVGGHGQTSKGQRTPGGFGNAGIYRLHEVVVEEMPKGLVRGFSGCIEEANCRAGCNCLRRLVHMARNIGMPGSNNDLNVLDASPMLVEYIDDNTPRYLYEVNGSQYSASVNPNNRNLRQLGSSSQRRRAGVRLQARFGIVARPALMWTTKIKAD